MNLKRFDKLLLMIEALLIVLDLAIYGKALVGMICYWTIVVLYHLTDVILGRKKDGQR